MSEPKREEVLLISYEKSPYTADTRRGGDKPAGGVPSPNRKQKRKKPKKPYHKLRVAAVLLGVFFLLECLYCFVVFTNNPTIRSLREAYIETAMSTMSHHWLAEWFFPDYMIDNVVSRMENAKKEQIGIVSKWEGEGAETPAKPSENAAQEKAQAEKQAFFELFWELDRATFEEYLSSHPEVLSDGWNSIYINESGLDDEGTSIYTTMGEQVLAIDAKNKILIVRVQGSGFIGALAIAKDPSQLSLAPSAYIGSVGQQLEAIAEENQALLAMTGSGFMDPEGNGSGGELAGYTMCQGVSYGEHFSSGYKRIELHEDNLLYVTDADQPVSKGTTDAVEFSPALIVDGKALVDEYSGWYAINPRACIGQSKKKEILMLVIEGRMVGRSLGCELAACVEILQRHDCYQAMNLDGGTSAVMWYDGQYVTKCSNTSISSRLLPNAWIYGERKS